MTASGKIQKYQRREQAAEIFAADAPKVF